jgi:hypothetical protein
MHHESKRKQKEDALALASAMKTLSIKNNGKSLIYDLNKDEDAGEEEEEEDTQTWPLSHEWHFIK